MEKVFLGSVFQFHKYVNIGHVHVHVCKFSNVCNKLFTITWFLKTIHEVILQSYTAGRHNLMEEKVFQLFFITLPT